MIATRYSFARITNVAIPACLFFSITSASSRYALLAPPAGVR
jgi:hypothetical protein